MSGYIYKKINFFFICIFTLGFCISFLLFLPFVQKILIIIGKKFYLLQFNCDCDYYLKSFKDWSKFFTPVFFMLLFFKIFSTYFCNNLSNSFINLLRCIACLMVFFLHASIFTNSRGVLLFEKSYTKILQTPAWGGVWIFFVLSGFLAGKGFASARYSFSKESVWNYYRNKIIKVIIPTFSFIFLCCVLVYPSFINNNLIVLLKFFTLSYNGNPGVNGIGATWYIFSLIPLYFLTPFFSLFLTKTRENFLPILFVIIVALGFFYRYFAVKNGINWYSMVYTPFFSNIDLFFGGFLLNWLIKKYNLKDQIKKALKDFFLFSLFVFILINTLFCDKFFFYKVFCPSIYLILVGICLIVFSDEKWVKLYNKPLEKILHYFSSISFEFYLFHSLVLYTILPAFKDQNVISLHFKLLFIGFLLTVICAIGFKRIFIVKKDVYQ